MEEVRAYVLEWVEGFHWCDGWHGGLRGGIAIAYGASVSGGRNIFGYPWPEYGGFFTCGHLADALVSCMECVEAGRS